MAPLFLPLARCDERFTHAIVATRPKWLRFDAFSGTSHICQQILHRRCCSSLYLVFPVPRFPGTISTCSSGKILFKVSIFLSFFFFFFLSFFLSFTHTHKTLLIINPTRASSIGPTMNHFYRLLVEDSKRRENLYRYLNSREAKEIENVYSKSR